MSRGRLRIYLGAAPGVGKTVAMLSEGQRRRARGTDVVIGVCETHGRAYTAELMRGLEVVPRRRLEHRGTVVDEMDVAAVLARRPEVALVDELAHTNRPGSVHGKRWQDVEDLLSAGIDVVSTVNIQHLESLNDVVEAITGVRQQETVPDDVVRSADQVELVDMSPHALRRRLAHGNVYAAEKVDAALANYFREGNLSALRELSLLWVADRVEEALDRYRSDHGIQEPWPTRERVVVGLSGDPSGTTVLRRAAQIASRGVGGELLAVHVAPADGLVTGDHAALDELRRLTVELGGTFHLVKGDDLVDSLLDFARGSNARQVVVGASRRPHWRSVLVPSVAHRVVERAAEMDVHMVPHEEQQRPGRSRPPRLGPVLGRRRVVVGWLCATVGLAALTAALHATRQWHDLPLDVLLYLTLTVLTALVGGLWPALATALLGTLALNWFFTPPYYTLTIASGQNLVAVVGFVVVAALVSSAVHLSERRAAAARAAQREADALSRSAEELLGQEDPLPSLVDQARHFFDADGVVLCRRAAPREPWRVVARSGRVDEAGLKDAPVRADVDEEHVLVLFLDGRSLSAEDRRLVSVFALRAASVLRRRSLTEQASQAAALGRDIRGRTALLAALSHDLRTPLAGVKAAVSSLRHGDVTFSPEDQAELLATIEEATDRLTTLVGNLLDMSRLQTSAVRARADALEVDAAVRAATAQLPDARRVRSTVQADLPLVVGDAGLLERTLVNVLENAVRHSPGRQEVVVNAHATAQWVEIRVVDRGPGVADALKEGIFQPFQRGGDAPAGLGVGLGLAVARGLLDVMGGTIGVEDTPGGGLTVWIRLPRAPLAAPAGQDEGERVPPAAPAGGASAAAPVSTAGTASREPAAPAPPRGGPR